MATTSVVFPNSGKCPFFSSDSSPVSNGFSTPVDHSEQDPLRRASQTPHFTVCNYQTNESVDVTVPTVSRYDDCRHGVCTSTLMSLPIHAHHTNSNSRNTLDELDSCSPAYVRKEAHDYQAIVHNDKQTSQSDYETRMEQINVEIQNTGTYVQTTDEIEYGCQMAWRNASRCINRLFWRSMKIIDRRYISNNDDMFKEICHHMRFAFNKGTLQATVLVFHPRARMWSTQYLRYACYEQLDGSLLGDPANRHLTKAAMQLGWNKSEVERTQWDLLPIIVQANPNEPPSWYELPEDRRLQIFLSHPDPKYDAAIKQLGLRWVVQPYVCDKAIEIGGIFYRCVPFSGWFMQTEIGRNLCDLQRYNFIPKLAALLDLDVTAAANSQMNVDRLYVEINAAVLYSFERAKITIVDHHTAAAGFQKFFKQEVNLRGNTPADWVWIVPPISGGMSSTFHQEMLNYVLKPRVVDQPDPWTYHYDPSPNQVTPVVPVEEPQVVVERRVLIHILYASASGTAQSYAEQMTNRLTKIGYNAKLMELDSFSFTQPNSSHAIVFIITSTFGQGNAPEGGQKVEEWLQNVSHVGVNSNSSTTAKRISLTNDSETPSLHWCTFAVCAIGSSAYPFFCGFGKLVDTAFQLLGGHRLTPLATCDALNQQYKNYNDWEERTVEALKKSYPPDRSSIGEAPPSTSPPKPSLSRKTSHREKQPDPNPSTRPNFIRLTFNAIDCDKAPSNCTAPYSKENPFSATVLQNIELTGGQNHFGDTSDYAALPLISNDQAHAKRLTIPSNFTNVGNDEFRSVRLLIFDSIGLTHYPGDHVCIWPENTLANVNGVIAACGWQLGNADLNKPCSLENITHGKYQTLRQILTNFVDLTTPLRPHVLQIIATYARDEHEQRQLLEFGKGGQRYTDWLINLPNVKETLEMFRSVRVPLEELIQLLPHLQPRYYSISSSNRLHPNQLHITVSVVTYTTPRGVIRRGVCSHYLQQTLPKLAADGKPVKVNWQRKPSRVRMFISANPHFRLPGQDSLSISITPEMITGGDAFLPLRCPLLMFAVGSGIAPFRSFWQELQVLERRQERVQVERVLFMGCRSANDFLYAKELQALTSRPGEHDKLFSTVIPVFSRENVASKRYIQDVMLDFDTRIYSMLNDDNAFVYMCGSIRSCQGIESTLASILQSCSEEDLTSTQATNRIREFKEFGRIKQDMFG